MRAQPPPPASEAVASRRPHFGGQRMARPRMAMRTWNARNSPFDLSFVFVAESWFGTPGMSAGSGGGRFGRSAPLHRQIHPATQSFVFATRPFPELTQQTRMCLARGVDVRVSSMLVCRPPPRYQPKSHNRIGPIHFGDHLWATNITAHGATCPHLVWARADNLYWSPGPGIMLKSPVSRAGLDNSHRYVKRRWGGGLRT